MSAPHPVPRVERQGTNCEDYEQEGCRVPGCPTGCYLVKPPTDPEHWTDETCTEVEYGINCGDPAECCDPVLTTDDPGTASEWAQWIREPHALTRTVTRVYGPWLPVDLEAQ